MKFFKNRMQFNSFIVGYTCSIIGIVWILVVSFSSIGGCIDSEEPRSASGVSKANTTVEVEGNKKTVEQNNVIQRLQMDNKPGSIKHLYVISAYSGQVIIYSTVKGKVTSSGKRLSPLTVESTGENLDGFPMEIGGRRVHTTEVLQDDGTYGSSIDYLYWWDSKGIYHQQYVSGGMILHISDQPMSVKNIIINMELQYKE